MPLLAPTFLFHFSAPCRRAEVLWPARDAPLLGDECRLPNFGELDGRRLFADLRMAWNEDGMGVEMRVTGKAQAPWCRETRVEDSDGLQLWLDTRDARNVHRANRFCHRFVFLPAGGGPRGEQPVAAMLPINRARELPKPVEPKQLRLASSGSADGYLLRVLIPATALTGYDPSDHPRMGLAYAVLDRELEWQTFPVGPEFPFFEDPSLWGTLELVES
jgi:hypothetical protein